MLKYSVVLLLSPLFVLACQGSSTNAMAAEPVYVAGADRLLSDAERNNSVAAGELLLGELNCLSCHVSESAATRIATKPAPILTSAMSRLKPHYVRQMLANPAAMKPGTTMPDLLQDVVGETKEAQIEALLHYLVSLGGLPNEELPLIGTKARGAALFHRLGCAACHGSQQAGEAPTPGSTPLGDVAAKYTLPGLKEFLLDPLHVRPGGRMPDLNLNEEEARAIAAFLLKLPEVARLRYAYFEGSWNKLPDFDSLSPVEAGGAESISVDVARERDHIGLRFEGYLRIDSPGFYRFYLGSDDGSRLRIDDQVVIDHGDIHPYSEKSAEVSLDAGIHAVQIDYFEQAGEERLTVEFEGPEVPRQSLDSWMTADRSSVDLDTTPLELQVDPKRAEQGRDLFASLGCAACHELIEDNQRLASHARSAPPLERLDAGRGCLLDDPPAGLPDYELSSSQRSAIEAALHEIAAPHTLTPENSIHRTLAQYQCYACHDRNGFGGITETRNAFFQTTIPEMGDEGRVPPSLTGVGGKLTRAGLEQILAEGAKDRPYMLTRMPKFGRENVGHLASLMESLEALEPLPAPHAQASLPEVKEAGRVMVGERGFSCIKCHTFGRFPAQGIQAMNLQLMSTRLRGEWFRRYMRNPQEFRPGTRMPSAWPQTGKSLLDQFFGGDVEQQINAVWVYLTDAERARIPSGLIIPTMELVPIDRAIIYRNFITGAGTRGIGVGYPEAIHQAFDANNMQIALLWQGRFIDASRHWSGRGDGFQPPAGEKVVQLQSAAAPPLAILTNLEQPWPAAPARQLGFRFRGYRLTSDNRPTFQYEYMKVHVDDFLDTQNLGPGDPVTRTLSFRAEQDGLQKNLWLRVAAGNIQEQADDWYSIDNQWRVRIEASSMPVLRESDSRSELLVPIAFQDGKAQVLERIQW